MSTSAHPSANTGAMRFHVDGWDPTYGSSVEQAETIAETTATVQLEVEVDRTEWKPVSPSQVTEPSAVLFVDGVRRIDARIWIEAGPKAAAAAALPGVDATTGEVVDAAASGAAPKTFGAASDAVMALCASYGAGTVCCCPDGGAHLLTVESRRGLFTTAANAADVATTAGTYAVTATPDDENENLAVLLSAALQRKLGELEVIVAANARAALATHGAASDTDLLVVDGPLRGRTHLSRALGFIKSHRTAYLPPELHAMVGTLAAGERTPVFLMGTSWDRHAWYLRLPCQPGAPWAGVARVECSADLSTADAVALANLSQVVLPRYASAEYKDTRAPQNLVPVAGLERELRRRLGNPALLTRALRIAAAGR